MVRSAPPGGDRPVIADLDNGRVFPAMARRLLPARRPFVWAVAACCLAASADAQAARRPGIEFACYFLRSPADCGFYEQVKAAGRTRVVPIGRAGSKGVRLVTLPGDRYVAGSGANERTDLSLSQSATDGYPGRVHWWAHSVLFPDDYVTQFNLAKARQADGDLTGAIAAYGRAAELAPEQAEFQLWHGLALERGGQTADAAAAYRRFLELEPNGPQAEKVKARLAQVSGGAGGTPVTP